MTFRFTSRSTVAAAGLLGLFASMGAAHAQSTTPFLYAANFGAGEVDTYNSAGSITSSTGAGTVFRADSVVGDASGNVYTTVGNQIFQVVGGAATAKKPALIATDPNADGDIFGLALNGSNLYFSSERTGNVYTVGTAGGTPTVFATGAGNPGALTFDSNGNLFVGDQGPGAGPVGGAKNGNTVFEVAAGSAAGAAATTFATGFSAAVGGTDVLGLSFNPADTGARAGTLYVSLDQNAGGNNAGVQIAQVAPGGTVSRFLATNTGNDPGFFLANIAFDQAGNLYYVSNGSGGSIYKVAPGANPGSVAATQFGTTNNGFGIALAPTAPAATPEPSQFVAFGLGMLGLGALALKARKRSSLTA